MCYFLVVLTRAAQISKGWFKLALTSVTWSSQFKEMNLRWLQWSQQVLKLVEKRTRDEQQVYDTLETFNNEVIAMIQYCWDLCYLDNTF